MEFNQNMQIRSAETKRSMFDHCKINVNDRINKISIQVSSGRWCFKGNQALIRLNFGAFFLIYLKGKVYDNNKKIKKKAIKHDIP